MDNRNVFATNLNRYMQERNVTRNDLSEAIGVSYFTVTDWVKGKKYPRMDKVELLAQYFCVNKSDLIEDAKKINLELFGKSPDEPLLTEGEKLWLELYRRTSEETRETIINMVESLEKLPNDQQQRAIDVIRVLLGGH